jgi:hypothetical protein
MSFALQGIGKKQTAWLTVSTNNKLIALLVSINIQIYRLSITVTSIQSFNFTCCVHLAPTVSAAGNFGLVKTLPIPLPPKLHMLQITDPEISDIYTTVPIPIKNKSQTFPEMCK